MSRSPELNRMAFIGGGNVAFHLIPWAQSRGFEVAALVHRTPERATELATHYHIPAYGAHLQVLPESLDILILSVPDAALSPLAEALAKHRRNWKGTLVIHLSGALPARVLHPLEKRGAHILSMHPLQTIRETLPAHLEGIPVALEGPPESITLGKHLAQRLTWKPFELSEEEKPAYHLMAVMVSNFLVTLFALAREIAPSSLTSSLGDLLYPLMHQTLENLRTQPPEEALTGPVVRGDLPTLQQHLGTLQQITPHLLPVYLSLLAETLQLAVQSGRLSSDSATQMLEHIENILPSLTPPTSH